MKLQGKAVAAFFLPAVGNLKYLTKPEVAEPGLASSSAGHADDISCLHKHADHIFDRQEHCDLVRPVQGLPC